MDALTRQLTMLYRDQILAQYAEWHTTPRHLTDRCKHGTYIGDPYGADYMCGMCEDGRYSEEQEAMVLAYNEATRTMALLNERSAAVQALVTMGAPITVTQRQELSTWAFSAIERDMDRLTTRHVLRAARREAWKQHVEAA